MKMGAPVVRWQFIDREAAQPAHAADAAALRGAADAYAVRQK